MNTIQLFDNISQINLKPEPDNWYAEPFTKRTTCRTPGQCGGDCDCGCPYNSMTEVERLPRIDQIAQIFPNEWLAFIISPSEDEEFEPQHGKLIAHSPDPDDLYDAVNTVLWNQHIYTFFNGDFAAMQASYGDQWSAPAQPPARRVRSGPKQSADDPTSTGSVSDHPLNLPTLTTPDKTVDLIYSALDQLYQQPNLSEAIRRLRLAKVRSGDQPLTQLLDDGLNLLETGLPRVDEVTWLLEEGMAELGLERF